MPVKMYYNKYKDKPRKESSLSSTLTSASNDKTLTMSSKEKKENTRMGKQAPSVYAAKIKTKIHNTSSFFKLSLKTNNKALALALVAQKQRSRELEMDVVRLRKEVQAHNFDLAFQRHKNKQLFAIIREFYDSSLNWMTKAVDIFSNEEVPESINTDAEHSSTEEQMYEMEAEVGSLQDVLKKDSPTMCPKQDHVTSESVNTAVVNADLLFHCSKKGKEGPSSPERDNPVLQNTLYYAEMDMTIADSGAEIVTVETNTRRNSKVMEEHQEKKDLCLSGKGSKSISADEEAPTESNYTAPVSKEITSATQDCSPAVQNREQNSQERDECLFGETESLTARRKTHVTSRHTKSSRRTCKQKNPDPRKTYLISQDPPNDILNDCFGDLEVQNCQRNKAILWDENLSCIAAKNKAKEAHATQEPESQGENNRRTYIFQDELRTQKSRKTKVSSLTMDQGFVHEDVESASTVYPQAAATDMHVSETTGQVIKHNNKTLTHPLSQFKECNAQKNRGTFVIQASESFVNGNSTDILNKTSILEDANRPDESEEVASEGQMIPQVISLDDIAEQQKDPVAVPYELSGENNYSERSHNVHNHLPESSQLTSLVPSKAKKHRTEVTDKVTKRNTTGKAKSKAVTRKQLSNSTPSNVGNSATEKQDVTDLENGEECRSLSHTLQLTRISHCSVSKEDFRNEHHAKTHKTNIDISASASSTFDKADKANHINMDDLCMYMDQTNHGHESMCRKTFMISSSHNSPGKQTNGSGASSCISEYHLGSDEVLPSVTLDSLNGHIKDQSLQFTEERPPWESLGGYTEVLSDESSAHSPQPKAHSQTMNIYQDQDLNLMHQPPEDRVMKSLTNKDWNVSSEFGRSRRRIAPVSYKEPTLNCKMRRGDKYSDSKFLNSPVFKDDKKKKRTQEKGVISH
ncbi:shugoshin 2 isoform X2 [Myxocyprinus asiaticus]|uniref:shugoshin 2 isoform X2 n=1 Tax=Myxocyprinus asiaticus TaxID=70543 RepID=UPI002221847E|nr:shugoshin 2 isoform X2 [Myxocyprinus asiaticus]